MTSLVGQRITPIVLSHFRLLPLKLVGLGAFGGWMVFALWRTSRAYLWLLAPSLLLTTAAVLHPGPTGTTRSWFDLLTDSGTGDRYFLASVFAVTALAFATAKKGGVIGWTSMVVAGSAFLLAMPTDAVEGARPGLHWARSASRFDAAAVGTPVSFGLYQSSEMVLVKRAGESVIPLACSKTVKAASVGLASPLDATAVGTHLTGGSTSRRGHCRF